jgi:SMODS and SLOG-associating 2TM effector domain 3
VKNGRVLGESVKTLTWRYMMDVEPFKDDAPDDQKFVEQLNAMRTGRSSLRLEASPTSEQTSPISPRMREVRRLAFSGRLAEYIRERIKKQAAAWYAAKSPPSGSLRPAISGTPDPFQRDHCVEPDVRILEEGQPAGDGLDAPCAAVILAWRSAMSAWRSPIAFCFSATYTCVAPINRATSTPAAVIASPKSIAPPILKRSDESAMKSSESTARKRVTS